MTKERNKTLYTENSIKSESAREFTRRVPATYLGSAKTNSNLLKEVFANSVDEYVIGHGNVINVKINTKDNVYQVEDFGQGFLVNSGIDEEGETILQRCFDKINTSGITSEDGVYNGTSLGLNGIGAKLTNWLSLNLHVITHRDGQSEAIWFKDGIFVKREVKESDRVSGTIVTWSPDPQFFRTNEPDIDALKTYFEEIAALCPTLTINVEYNDKTMVFSEPEGLNALMNKRVSGKELFTNRFVFERQLGKDKLNICLTYTSDYSESINAYVNLGYTDGGAHFTGFRTAFVRAINKYATDTGLLKKSDKNLNSAEISEGLCVIFNMTTTTARYDAQSKSRIDDIDNTIINNVIGGDFATWLINNPNEAKIIIERALNARKAREAAQKAKEKIREAGNTNKKSIFVDLPSKLSDAYPKNKKDRSKCELYIGEGDSACSSINGTKDSSFQATFPIRGKILNCQKASPEKVYANQEIANITKALGLDIDKTTGKLIYDSKKLRYNKIIIASDEDVDGYAIASLLITVFNWLCPELIHNGHLYHVHGALFKATFNDKSHILFYTDAEYQNWKKTNTKPYTLTRAKGLGELTKDETYEQLVNPATRNLHQLVVEDIAEFEKYLEIFQGTEVDPRRDYLEEHFNDYVED